MGAMFLGVGIGMRLYTSLFPSIEWHYRVGLVYQYSVARLVVGYSAWWKSESHCHGNGRHIANTLIIYAYQYYMYVCTTTHTIPYH